MIITIEGASAVGKTSTCRELVRSSNACHILEVNDYFIRDLKNEPEDWYLQRNRDRWLLAEGNGTTHSLVLIDVDIFQPLYYNWAFHYKNLQSLDLLTRYYEKYIADGTLCFPDRYVYLYVKSLKELQRRKESDTTRLRGGFQKNLQLISGTQPQLRYFQALNSYFPGYVTFVEAESVDENISKILGIAGKRPHFDARSRSHDILETMVNWLSTNEP